MLPEAGENYTVNSFIICIAHKMLFGYQTKKDETSRVCDTYV
jgi:hypothetical protein